MFNIMIMNDPKLQQLIDVLVPALKPEQIYLFGSRARGDAHEWSDYDLCVIMPDDAPKELMDRRKIFYLARPTNIPSDIIAKRRSRFDIFKPIAGSMAHAIANEGKIVYERA